MTGTRQRPASTTWLAQDLVATRSQRRHQSDVVGEVPVRGSGGEFTGRRLWAPRVREDAHARVWIQKSMEYARTHTCVVKFACARHVVRERGSL